MSKVLLVEDDNNLREIYEARLQAEGYDITSAQDGEQALVVAKAEKPDLIISDVMMPKISGFEMLDILRNTQGLKETKVIMLTALGQADDRTRADSLGADKYLVKSQVTLEDIVKTAHELLEDGVAPASPVADATAAVPVTEPTAVTPASTTDATMPVAAEPAPSIAPAADDTTTPPADNSAASDASQVADQPAQVVPATPSVIEPTVAPAPNTAPVTDTNAPSEAPAEPASEPPLPAVDAPASTPDARQPAPGTDVTASEGVPSETTDAPEQTSPVETPTAEPAPSTDLPVSESTAEEQATVNSQIEDFIKNNAVEVPSEEPTPPPNANTDRVMQESVDTLIASTEPGSVAPTPAPAAPTPEPAPQQEPVAEKPEPSDDGVTIAHKKVIPRPDSSAKPDLSELLAREEAKNIVTGTAQPVVSEPTAPATPPSESSSQAPQPGNTVTPSNTPPKPTDGLDPNSVAL